MVNVVIKLKDGFTLQDVAAECFAFFGTGHPEASNQHEYLPQHTTGIDPWQEGGYVTCKMPESYAQSFEQALQTQEPTTCQLVRVEWGGQIYAPITFTNAEGKEQQICAMS